MPNTTLYRASQNHNGCQLVSCFTLPHGRHARRLVKTPTSHYQVAILPFSSICLRGGAFTS